MRIFLLASLLTLLSAAAFGQTPTATPTKTITVAEKTVAAPRSATFRPSARQVKQAQEFLKAASLYSGEATGKYNEDTRKAIKKYQAANGLADTGNLNRATLESMKIELTDKQKEIPIPASSYATKKEDKPVVKTTKSKGSSPIFRATVDQIKTVQRILKEKSLYSGEETGKLNADTRSGLKKFQLANNIKDTGTLNRVTLEALGIELTDQQKAQSADPK